MSLLRLSVITAFLAALFLNACSAVRLNAIPEPPPTAKLRVFLQTVSEEPTRSYFKYAVPHEKFEAFAFRKVGQYLQDTGIYEVVSKADTLAVLGQRAPGSEQYWWVKKDYALLRQAGKALYADYAMIVMRSLRASEATYKIVLINIETGAQYSTSDSLFISKSTVRKAGKRNMGEVGVALMETMYRKLFYDAKGDLLATAVRKGRLMPEKETKKPAPMETKVALAPPPATPPVAPAPVIEKSPAPVVEQPREPTPVATAKKEVSPVSAPPPEMPAKPSLVAAPVKEETPAPKPALAAKPELPKEPVKPEAPVEEAAPQVVAKATPVATPEKTADEKRKEFEKKLENEFQTEAPPTDKTKVVVYDFDAMERLQVVALILTDALREELFILGRFSLVNRENMVQVMEEMKLQHSGLVDEKQVVELGKWLAANQAVTGRLAALGNSCVLQAKRTDIKTMGTLGLGMLKCTSGQEEELLSGIPALARKLVGMRSDPK